MTGMPVAPVDAPVSPLLSTPGAVAAEGVDAGVAAHYGDPMREQRLLEEGLAVVDLSNRPVITVSGQDRLTWLHSMTTQQLTGWKSELARHAIQPIQQFANTVGKNSTDSALIIDAMDLLYSGNLDAFALVSSDSDFTRLATRLRESGKTVYGLGQRKTPPALQAACDKFIFLEVLREEAGPADEVPASADDDQGAPLPDLRPILETAIRSTAQEDGWSPLSAVGSYLGKAHASFDPRNYNFSRLGLLVEDQNYLDVEHPEGAQPRVRLRSQRPPRKRTPAKKAAPRS